MLEANAISPRSRSTRRAGELIQRPGFRRRQQLEGLAERAGLHARLRRRQRALGVPRRIGGQQHRPFQERRGRGQPAPGLRSPGRSLQLRGDLLIRPGRGLGPVPGPAVRIGLRIGHLGQRRVHLLSVGERRRPVGHRTCQRMPEPHPAAELDQPRLCRRRRRGWTGMPSRPAARQTSARSPDGSAAASCSSRRVSAGRASSWRAKLSSIRPVSGTAPGRPNPPGQLRRGQPARQFQQRQRIAAGLGDDQVADPRVQRPGQRRVQQRPRVIVSQPVDLQLGQPGQIRRPDRGPRTPVPPGRRPAAEP